MYNLALKKYYNAMYHYLSEYSKNIDGDKEQDYYKNFQKK